MAEQARLCSAVRRAAHAIGWVDRRAVGVGTRGEGASITRLAAVPRRRATSRVVAAVTARAAMAAGSKVTPPPTLTPPPPYTHLHT